MSSRGNPFKQLSKKNKVILASVLGSVLFLSTLTPVLNIPFLPSSLLPAVTAAPGDDKGKKDEKKSKFNVVETSIADIHNAIKKKQATCTDIVQAYIDRAKAYNGVCTMLTTADGAPVPAATGKVMAGSPTEFPTETFPITNMIPDFGEYIGTAVDFGRMDTTISDPSVQQQYGMRVGIPNAGQLNALETINIRGERSVTCKGAFDAHPSTGPLPAGAPEGCEEFRQLPDALETAAMLDAKYGSNPPLDELPMYCTTFSVKNWYEAKDMRSTGGDDVNFAMDAPPEDSDVASLVREKGAIIFAIANASPSDPSLSPTPPDAPPAKVFLGFNQMGAWGGQPCNPYDTERTTRGTSSGSGVSVSGNLVNISICEQTAGSCKGPASRNNIVLLLMTKGLFADGGIFARSINDRAGIHARTVADAASVLDAIKGYDSREYFTAIPNSLIPEEPYTSFVVDDNDLKKNKKPLEGMRIGIAREFMIKPTLNDEAITDKIDNEIKTILRDKLGAELVESYDPSYPGVFPGITDDPDVPNMGYTFQDALAEIMPLSVPEYFHQKTGGALEFAVPGWDVTTKDYAVALGLGDAPLSENLNLRRISSGLDNAGRGHFNTATYLTERGDTRVYDWKTWCDNEKFNEDSDRRACENAVDVQDLRATQGIDRVKMREVMRLVVEKVMHENGIDAFVDLENSLPHQKIGGPTDPTVFGRGASGYQSFTATIGIPEIIVPAGYNQIVYEPQFQLTADKTRIIQVTGTEQSLLPVPMPIAMQLWAGPGDESSLIKIASAYQAATHHRVPPPDFGPLPE
jgi:Asp-tRNA(Asn)/Glu-tRNA(Gln) amidotransferase A subunit family amidase